MSPDPIFPWTRFWVRNGEEPIKHDGFFVEPSSKPSDWLAPSSNGVPFSHFNGIPLVVLLGDVGMGKSTTVKEQVEKLKAFHETSNHCIHFCDLKRRTESRIVSDVFESEEMKGWVRGDHALTVILDSLDECWRRLDELETVLVGELEKHSRHLSLLQKHPKLFLRLTCRSAEWRPETGRSLAGVISKLHLDVEGNNVLHTYALAPLSRENIRTAAEAKGIDGDTLIEAILEKDAQPLAIHPITFEILLNVFAERGDFPNTRRELFELACDRLVEERNSVPGSSHQRQTLPNHRTVIAERLAATSVLSNRNLLNPDFERTSARVDVLNASDICGYYQEPSGGTAVSVERTTMTETLQSGLFSAGGSGGDPVQQFRHPAYGDFLAARYLSRLSIPTDQLAAVLTDTSNNSNRLFPQVEETASWLADLRPGLFELLLPTNAVAFLRCEPKHLNQNQKAALVKTLLDLFERHEAVELDWQIKHRLRRLDHPTIADQLRPVIADKGAHPLVREAALDIAEQCRRKELAETLACVFLDRTDVYRLRKRAGYALQSLADQSLRQFLKGHETEHEFDESDDELKGCLLKLLWPSVLSLNELLDRLTPPRRRNFLGSYRSLIEFDLPRSIPDPDLPLVLKWIRKKQISLDTLEGYGHFPEKIIQRSLEQLANPATRNELIELIRSLDQELYRFFRAALSNPAMSDETRLKFVTTLVESDLDLSKLLSHSWSHQTHLLHSGDVVALYEQWKVAAEPAHKDRWRQMVFYAFTPEDPDALAVVFEFAESDPTAAHLLKQLTSCPIVPDKENWRKQNHIANQERERQERMPVPLFDDRIRSALNAFNDGRIHAFWHLIDLLQSDPSDTTAFGGLDIQLSEGKAWKALSEERRAEILEAIPRYLQHEQFTEEQLWDSEKNYRCCSQVIPSLVLLFDEHTEGLNSLPIGLWEKWSPVLIAYRHRLNGGHDQAEEYIYRLAAEHALSAFQSAIQRHLDTSLNEDHKRGVLPILVNVLPSFMEDLFKSLLTTKPVHPSAAADLFHLLFDQDLEWTANLLVSLVESRNAPDSCSPLAPTAAAILMTNAPKMHGSWLIALFRSEPDFGRAAVPRVLRVPQTTAWMNALDPSDVAEFWDWLEQAFPGDPYEDDEDGTIKARFVTVSHDIYHFRNAVLDTLAKSGTREGCGAMVELMRKRPKDFWLGNILAQMRSAVPRSNWSPPNPSDLMTMFAEKERRLVRTAGDLHTFLVESIRRYEEHLHGNPPSTELWNCPQKGSDKIWSPKDENELSDCLKRHIERDLSARGIVANREVQIARRFGDDSAELVDLLIQATPTNPKGNFGRPVSVVVEVKCAWNKRVFDDLEAQLFSRYLRRDYDFGIYVVAQFACQTWNRGDDQRKNAQGIKTSISDLQTHLEGEALRLSSQEKKVTAIVLDAGMR